MTALQEIKILQDRINASIIGQEDVVRKILIVFLADGNLLLEGLPGLAKTRAIKSLSKELKASLSRIQFTPDLLPSDITGTEIYQPELKDPFVFKKGPIFANLVLADEINRAPAKVQAALLEAMEERQVTVAGKTYKMEDLFLVMATQNPVEQEGTYPLPEAQMDRFLMKILMDYPSAESEEKILELVSAESRGEFIENEPILQDVVFEARKEIRKVEVSKAARKYIVDLINATRYPSKYSEDLDKWIEYGASPRGTIALERCAKVVAWFNERTYIEPDDIREVIHEILRHRLILSYEANAQRISPDMVIDELLKSVAVL